MIAADEQAGAKPGFRLLAVMTLPAIRRGYDARVTVSSPAVDPEFNLPRVDETVTVTYCVDVQFTGPRLEIDFAPELEEAGWVVVDSSPSVTVVRGRDWDFIRDGGGNIMDSDQDLQYELRYVVRPDPERVTVSGFARLLIPEAGKAFLFVDPTLRRKLLEEKRRRNPDAVRVTPYTGPSLPVDGFPTRAPGNQSR